MAIAFRSSGTGTQATTATSISVTAPAGLVAGDIVLVAIQCSVTGAVTAPANQGFNLLASQTVTNFNTIFWKVADGGETSWSFSTPSGTSTAVAVAYSGVEQGWPFDVVTAFTDTTASTSGSYNLGTQASTVANTVCVAFCSEAGNTAQTSGNSSYAKRVEQITGTTLTMTCFDIAIAAAAGTNPATSISTLKSVAVTSIKILLHPQKVSSSGIYCRATSGNTSASASSITLTAPFNIKTGDVMIAEIVQSGTGTLSAPANWVSLFASSTANSMTHCIFYKVATASDTSTSTYAFTSTVSNVWAGSIAAYVGVSNVSPVEITGTNGSGSAATTGTVNGITTTKNGDFLLACLGTTQTVSQTFSIPTGWYRGNVVTTTAIASAIEHQNLDTAGSVSNLTITFAGSSSYQSRMIALQAGGSGGGYSGWLTFLSF